jgi:hypothetical protein
MIPVQARSPALKQRSALPPAAPRLHQMTGWVPAVMGDSRAQASMSAWAAAE